MRNVLFVLAVLGAVFSGWVPAIAATLNAGQPAGLHALHQMPGEHGGSEHGKSRVAAHPVVCSACFAIEAARIEPRSRVLDISSHVSAAMPQLYGLVPPPLDPPPRS